MFNIEKTTQAAAYLLRKAGGSLNYTAFLKLLYRADKKMLVDWGFPITFDDWVSMPSGPILRRTYDLIRKPVEGSDYWSRFIRTLGFDLYLLDSPGDDLLSEAEENTIDFVFAEQEDKTEAPFVEQTPKFAEWSDLSDSSRQITLRDVLMVEGFPSDLIEEIVNNIESDEALLQSISEVVV